jgi:hypothetical protein
MGIACVYAVCIIILSVCDEYLSLLILIPFGEFRISRQPAVADSGRPEDIAEGIYIEGK